MEIYKTLVCLLVLASMVSAASNFTISYQMTSVRNISSGSLVNASLEHQILNSTDGTLIHSDTFALGDSYAILNGSANAMIGENVSNPLALLYGEKYYIKNLINGEAVSYTNLSGGATSNLTYYSPLGDIQWKYLISFPAKASCPANYAVQNATITASGLTLECMASVFPIYNNLSLSDIVSNIGNWTLDKVNYYTKAQTEALGNLTNYYNKTTIDVNISGLQGAINNDRINISIHNATITELIGNVSGVNATILSLNNLSYAQIAANIGNWSFDKTSYYTRAQTEALGNLTNYYNKSISDGRYLQSEANFSAANPTLARTGTCPNGYAVQNTTTSGVQCFPTGSSNASGTVTQVDTTGGIQGGPITTTGTISLNQTFLNLYYLALNGTINWSNITNVPYFSNGSSNLTLAQIAANIGNWTLDKTSYYTMTQVEALGNLTNYYNKSISDGRYLQSEANYSANNATIARVGNCTAGQFVTNTTNTGVICAAPAGSGTVQNIGISTGISSTSGANLTGTGTLSLDTTYLQNFNETGAITNDRTNISAIMSNFSNFRTTASTNSYIESLGNLTNYYNKSISDGRYLQSEANYSANNATIARTGTCAANQFVWNSSTSGIQCAQVTAANISSLDNSHTHAAENLTSGTLGDARLNITGVTAGMMGNANTSVILTWDTKGRITAASNATITPTQFTAMNTTQNASNYISANTTCVIIKGSTSIFNVC